MIVVQFISPALLLSSAASGFHMAPLLNLSFQTGVVCCKELWDGTERRENRKVLKLVFLFHGYHFHYIHGLQDAQLTLIVRSQRSRGWRHSFGLCERQQFVCNPLEKHSLGLNWSLVAKDQRSKSHNMISSSGTEGGASDSS